MSDFATLWTVAHQAPLSMGFSRQECWSGFSCPPTGDLPNQEIKPVSLSPASAGRFLSASTIFASLSYQPLHLTILWSSYKDSFNYIWPTLYSRSISGSQDTQPHLQSPFCYIKPHLLAPGTRTWISLSRFVKCNTGVSAI